MFYKEILFRSFYFKISQFNVLFAIHLWNSLAISELKLLQIKYRIFSYRYRIDYLKATPTENI